MAPPAQLKSYLGLLWGPQGVAKSVHLCPYTARFSFQKRKKGHIWGPSAAPPSPANKCNVAALEHAHRAFFLCAKSLMHRWLLAGGGK